MLYLITIVFVDLLFIILLIVQSLPLICFVLFYKHNKNLFSILIFCYCLYSIINDLIRRYTLPTISFQNFPKIDFIFLSIYTIIEYTLLSVYIYNLLRNKLLKNVLLILSALFLAVAIGNLVYSYQLKSSEIDSIPLAISSLILISGSLIYFFETIQNPEITFIYSKPSFWVIVGIMIYFSGTFFLFLQYENLSEHDKETFWIINMICFILKNIFFSISFILKPENQQISNVDDYYLNKLE